MLLGFAVNRYLKEEDKVMATALILKRVMSQGHRTSIFRYRLTITRSVLVRRLAIITSFLFVLAVVAGCASTKVTSRDRIVYERSHSPAISGFITLQLQPRMCQLILGWLDNILSMIRLRLQIRLQLVRSWAQTLPLS